MDPKLTHALLARINRIPIVATIGLEILVFGDGFCESRAPRYSKYDGVFESFHGGLLMTIADSTACFAILTRTGPDTKLTTTDMNIRFLAPCLTAVTAKAKVVKFGRTLCPVAVDLYDQQEQHVATAQVTYILLSGL
jgi:uncharacterized protein (TIGR00369 family)